MKMADVKDPMTAVRELETRWSGALKTLEDTIAHLSRNSPATLGVMDGRQCFFVDMTLVRLHRSALKDVCESAVSVLDELENFHKK
jgi:hypothetical protein